MTEPITTQTQTQKRAYVQLDGGAYNAHKGLANADIGVLLGGEIEKKGNFLKGEVGCGTAFKAGLEVGHEFPLGKKTGVELAANAQYLRSTQESHYSSSVNVNNSQPHKFSTDWHNGYFKSGVSGMLNFTGKRGNIKAGIEAGYRTNFAPDIQSDYTVATADQTVKLHQDFKSREKGAYVTPKISAELNLGKKGNWSMIADADLYQGQAGIRYTF